MIFKKLNEKNVEDAVKLAQADYDMERKYVKTLYEKDFRDELTHFLNDTFKNKYGAIAIENGKLRGFIAFCDSKRCLFKNIMA